MKAEPVDVAEGQVVLERPAALPDVLIVALPTGVEHRVFAIIDIVLEARGPAVVAEDDVRTPVVREIQRCRIVVVLKIIDRNLVQEAVTVVLVPDIQRACIGIDLVGARIGIRAAEIADVRLVAIGHADVEALAIINRPGQLAEEQILLERSGETAGVGTEQAGIGGTIQDDGIGSGLVLALIGSEEMQPVLDDRTAHRQAILHPLQIRPGIAPIPRETVLVGDEGIAAELIGPRAGHRRDDRGRSLLVLRLEILADDPEFLNARLGEGVAATVVLTGHATIDDGRFLVLAVNEDVDRRCALTTGGNGPLGLTLGHAHTGCQGREIEEVAADLRQVVDLRLADVGGDFRRPHLEHAATGDDHIRDLRTLRRVCRRQDPDVQIEGPDLAQGQGHRVRGRLTIRCRDIDPVAARAQA